MPSTDSDEAGRESATNRGDSSTFRRTLIRVMTMQVAALLALWILQSIYAPNR